LKILQRLGARLQGKNSQETGGRGREPKGNDRPGPKSRVDAFAKIKRTGGECAHVAITS